MTTTKLDYYGRVRTEDNQDPAPSKDGQLTRTRTLIEPVGGVVDAEYFDRGNADRRQPGSMMRCATRTASLWV